MLEIYDLKQDFYNLQGSKGHENNKGRFKLVLLN